MADQTKQTAPGKPGHTQGARRLKYGLNVTVAVVAAAALAVLLNWIAYREYVRIDMTASRRYSLSEQTEQLLNRIDKDEKSYELVTLYRVSGEHLERINDLVDEYARYSQNLEVHHIDPGIDVAERDAFYSRLMKRYDEQIQPVDKAVTESHAQLSAVMGALSKLLPELKSVAEHPELSDQQLKETSDLVVRAFSRFKQNREELKTQLEAALDQPMPRYNDARSSLRSVLQQLDERLLSPAVVQFQAGADRASVPAEVQNTLLSLSQKMKAQQTKVNEALGKLSNVQTPSRYNAVRSALNAQQSLVVMSPSRVRVIPANELYRQPDERVVQAEGEPELQFLGEEKITGALVSMQLDQPPMVVFCYTGQRPALGRRGQYTQVAERLRSTNFDVQQWNPTGGGRASMRRMQMQQASEPPQPEEGQPVVWIVLPSQPQNPRRAMMQGGNQGEQQVLEHVSSRLAQGDSAMLMLAPDPMSSMRGPDPVSQMLETWGITPQLDRLVMREMQVSQQRTQATRQVEVSQWPDGLPVTRALAGMPAMFIQSSPIETRKPDEMDVKHWPLAQLSGKRVWAEADLSSPDAIQNASYDAEDAKDAYTVAVAAESGDKRMVVVTDPAWASDPITTAGQLGGRIVPGMADMTGAAFPGNSELFVNSVYWLSGLDELIAASPRTQDIRRIGAMSDTAAQAYQWSLLAGMPAAVLLIGMGVWLVRRRG